MNDEQAHSDLYFEALGLVADTLERAKRCGLREPTAMNVATVAVAKTGAIRASVPAATEAMPPAMIHFQFLAISRFACSASK